MYDVSFYNGFKNGCITDSYDQTGFLVIINRTMDSITFNTFIFNRE